MIVHRDPTYMPADRADWCSHNAAVFGDACEATVWAGTSRTNARTGQPVRLFKSWASQRHVEAAEVLAEHTFLHPSLTPGTLRATHDLLRWQGVDGLHFAGHFTTITDLQETALYSAMTVADMVSPDSPRVRAVRRRLAGAGRPEVSYDVGVARR